MGDRGNIAIPQWNGQAVYLYTHWNGSYIGSVTQRALRRGLRWDDPPYLARIIFEELIKGQEGTETGFGISTSEPDNNHPTLFVDCDLQQVRSSANKWSFQEFIQLEDVDDILNRYSDSS